MINAFKVCRVSAFLLLFSLLLRFKFAEFFYGFNILTNRSANAQYAYESYIFLNRYQRLMTSY